MELIQNNAIRAFLEELSLDPTAVFLTTTTVVSLAFCFLSIYLFISLHNHKKLTNERYEYLTGQLHTITNASVNIGHRVKDIEHNMNHAINKQIDFESRYPELKAFDKAESLLKKGASAEDLIAEGLNRPEAELFSKLHKAKKVV